MSPTLNDSHRIDIQCQLMQATQQQKIAHTTANQRDLHAHSNVLNGHIELQAVLISRLVRYGQCTLLLIQLTQAHTRNAHTGILREMWSRAHSYMFAPVRSCGSVLLRMHARKRLMNERLRLCARVPETKCTE